MMKYSGNIVTLLLIGTIISVVDATNPIFSSTKHKNKLKDVIAKKQQYYNTLKKRAASGSTRRSIMHSEEYYRKLQVPTFSMPVVPPVPPAAGEGGEGQDDDFWTSFFGNTTTDSLFDTNFSMPDYNFSMPDYNFSMPDIFGNMSDLFGNMSDAFGYGSDCDIDPSYIEKTDSEFPGANFSCMGLYCGSFEFMGSTVDSLILNCDAQCELCIDNPIARTTTVDDEAGDNKLCSYVNVVNDYTTEVGPDGTETKTMHTAVCTEQFINGDSWDPIEVCLGYNETSTNCEIEHTIGYFGNASKCNSCTTLMCDDDGSGSSSIFGVQADCTNIHSDAMIDTCTGDGYVGDFAIMPILVNNENVYTVGECKSGGAESLGGLLDVFFGNASFCDLLEADASMESEVTGGEGGPMAIEFPDANFDCTGECDGNIFEQSCTAGCEVCDDTLSVCGIWSDYMYMDFTSMLMPITKVKMCLDITQGGEDDVDGKLCLAMNDDSGMNCTISYNDDVCNSCTQTMCDEDEYEFGFIADCTNINPAANINGCKKEGFVGPFRILDDDAFDTNNTSTNCNYITTTTAVATTTDDSETITANVTNATTTTTDDKSVGTTTSTNGEDEDATTTTTTTTTTGDDEATTTATNGGEDDKDDAFVLFHQSSSLLWKSIVAASLIGLFMNV